MLPLVEMMLVLQIAAPGDINQVSHTEPSKDVPSEVIMLQTTDEVIEALALIKGRGKVSEENAPESIPTGFSQ